MLTRKYIGNVSHFTSKNPLFEQFLSDPLKIVVVPINARKLFIYYKHHDSLQNKKSRIQTSEKWIVDKFSSLWLKLVNSQKSYNQRIVSWVNRTVDKIPWQESSLLTVPGESYIMKRLLHDPKKVNKEINKQVHVTAKEYENMSLKPQIQPINLYYPTTNTWNINSIEQELKRFSETGIATYKKRTVMYLSLLPFTLPVALLPIVPNIPGFYLAYRSYCSYKAYLGAKHLKSLLNNNGYSGNSEKTHPVELPEYTELIDESSDLTEETIDNLVELLDIKEMRNTLLKVVRQEKAKI
ncbi:hypothetical protein C6P45_000683 [Maudiozyma exigua]|uniref:Mitochondrial K+-H+ exchange-related-domain-containing protein n=1 Tax=Maudiozyma exigua TaxID=34358 RepID=A0A9P6W592_MAUEX|nr:hypothetical protein C6P45_000683 [Kazachstania exigua]